MNCIEESRKCSLLLLLFLFVAIPWSALRAQNKGVSLSVKNVTLKHVFDQIEKTSVYRFTYLDNILPDEKNVTYTSKNQDVESVLKQLLIPRNLTYNRSGNTFSIIKGGGKQKRILKGTVKDSKGEALIGVNVVVKGTPLGTVTDFDGNFSIDTSPNSQLEFTYIGYAPQTVKAGERSSLHIVLLEDAQLVNEVVVVGYGTQKKVNLTGAVAQVDSKTLEGRPVSNVSQMLQGAIPNLNISFGSGRPGEGGSFNIRGMTSINGGSPLVLIDGVEGSIDRINPNDVESVSVLKDASASAIYGARASYGVILVSTKKGKSGKAVVNYSGKFAFAKSTTSTDFETRGYYSALINDTFYKAYAGKNYTNYTEVDYEQLWIRKDDKTEHPDRPWVTIDQRDGRDTYVYYANTDWYNYLYDDSRPTWEHNLSFSGGNDKIQYLISGGYFDQDGIFNVGKKDNYKTYNFRSKIDAEVTDWLSVSSNTKFFKSTYEFPGYGSINDHFDYIVLNALASFVPVNPDGTATYFNSLSSGRISEGRHTMLVNDKHRNQDEKNDFSTTFEATFKLYKGLNLKANYTYSFYNGVSMNRSAPLEYSKYPGEILERTDDIGLDRLTEITSNQNYNALNVYASYEKQFKNHELSVIGGYNYETRFAKSLKAQREGLLTTELNDFNLAKGQVMNIAGGRNRYKIMGLFYRLNYDYKGKYLFETSGRYDGTSRFYKGNRFGFFPSASLGWRVSEENFFEPLRKTVDNLKLRLSYGELGNQLSVGYYDFIQTINTSGEMMYSFGEGAKAPYASVSPLNGKLTWEKVETINGGLDINLLQNRFSVSADYYVRNTKGMIAGSKMLPAVYGDTPPKMNAADLRTKGWELSLQWRDRFQFAGSSFNYNIGFGLSDNVSHITRFDNPTKNLLSYYEGQRIGDIWGYTVDGFFMTDEDAANYHVDQSAVNATINASAGAEKGLHAGDLKYVDIDGDNVISMGANTADNSGDRRIIGNSQERFRYGINAGFDWYNIDFSVFFQGIGRKHWYPATQSLAFWGPYSRPFATFIPEDFLSDVWSPENPNAYYPRPRGYVANDLNRELGAVNNRYLQNLAYCRLKNLTIGYSLPQKLASKVMMNKVRVYFSGENLLTLTKLRSKYIDPEQASSGKGGYGKVYPWSKTFSFGIDVTF